MITWGMSIYIWVLDYTSKGAVLRFQRIFALSFLVFISALPFGAARAATNVLFILDSSGSMWERVNGVPKIVIAKRVLNDTLSALPADTQLGLMTYGHRRKGDCNDIEMLSPIGTAKSAAIAAKVRALTPKGETPIAAALMRAADALKKFPSDHNHVVLITDGAEECRGDPCAAARELAAAGLDVRVDVVGFNLKQKQRDAVECIAREGQGKYYDAKDQKSLSAAMVEVKQEVVSQAPTAAVAKPPKEFNLLLAANGGQLVAAPSENWANAITGKDRDTVRLGAGDEAVYAFKDEKAATFSKFSILIAATRGENIKGFELFAADAPAGAFRSLGRFTTQNLRLVKSPYQEFTFPETTAKYLKIKILSDHADFPLRDADLTQIRLIGKLTQEAPSPAAIKPSEEFNLLLAANGGRFVTGANANWANAITGKDADIVRLGAGDEAVFAFKGGKAATFSTFSILIAATNGGNIKDFELFAADAPTGAFRSLGRFTTQNVRLIKSPYQEFTFPETTAKYLKIKILSDHAGWPLRDADLTQVRLIGKLAN